LILSAAGSQRYATDSIAYSSSLFGDITSINVQLEDMLDSMIWVFEANPKHGVKPRIASGTQISAMDLTSEQAQTTLSNGIEIQSRVYGYTNNSWYQFHCHHGNMYHGFKINVAKNNPEHTSALGKMTELEFKSDCGQVFT
ncbi:hypothetical protein, partial [Pseudomonas viridiflava]|uniref:hypothetical protein n=1 Tax=Pseudomonas viridiflava TaxID=33069 RepID=UPI0013DF136A